MQQSVGLICRCVLAQWHFECAEVVVVTRVSGLMRYGRASESAQCASRHRRVSIRVITILRA